tara:strand:- start:125 stop:640 length:516 start_codon:yes stop_codon:yes gene_type:complete
MLSAGAGKTNVFETVAAAGGKFESKLLYIVDEKSSGTAGGSSTTGSWLTRDLNTVVTNEITGASLASDQITLAAGTYFIQAGSPAYEGQGSQVKLYNITDTADELIGGCIATGGSLGIMSRSLVFGRFTIDAEKDFEIQMQFGGAKASTGMGRAAGFSVVEKYTYVLIWQM